jgi:uncharacterized protein with HEPN domain
MRGIRNTILHAYWEVGPVEVLKAAQAQLPHDLALLRQLLASEAD